MTNNNDDEKDIVKPDFSFKDVKDSGRSDFGIKDISEEIDKVIDKKKKSFDPEKEFKIEHLSDKIRFAKKVRENPPVKGFMDIEAKDADMVSYDEDGNEVGRKKAIAIISEHEEKDKESGLSKVKRKIALYDGIFNIDLNVDAYWWFVRSCNVFPTILDQGIRTHLDIKKAHEPEKRKIEFPWILIGLVVSAIFFIFLIFHFLTKGG